jgi:hypothetical protein
MPSHPSNGSSVGNHVFEKDATAVADFHLLHSSTNGHHDKDSNDMNDTTDLTSTDESARNDGANPKPVSKPTSTKRTTTYRSVIVNHLCRIVGLDIPFILILGIYLSMTHLHWLSYNYLVPLNSLQYFDTHERDITYYHRICTVHDQTTNDTEDLIVDLSDDTTTEDRDTKINHAVQKMLRHGVTILPNLISETTATALRDYILQQNQINDHLIYVIENEFRWSFPIQVDQDPIISQALQEILLNHNPNLISYLEAVMGPNPAVIEFTAITQAYGAKEQFWHQDGT